MAHPLPQYLLLGTQSRPGKYLRYVSEDVPGVRHGYLQLEADEAVSPYTKFELEFGTTQLPGGNNQYHIKSCYNNKYWAGVSNSAGLPQSIAACADDPTEDTLFGVNILSSGGITFRHIKLQGNVVVDNQRPHCLMVVEHMGSGSFDSVFRVTDWESLSILPVNVVFKGVAEDDKYLSGNVVQSQNHLQLSATSNGSDNVRHQAFNAPDGSVRIRSVRFNRFWRRNGDRWILADAAQNDNRQETKFQPIIVGEDTVAIRSLDAANLFLARATRDRRTDCLSADMKSPMKQTILKVEEPILNRSIYGIDYKLSEGTIYNAEPVVLVTASASNAGTEPETLTIRMSYTEETSTFFTNSISVGANLSYTFKFGIPIIASGKIEVSASANYDHTWGKTSTTSRTDSMTETFRVAPGTRVNVSVIATKGMSYVPFSYTQRDVLTNGREIYTTKHDGLYIGANCFNINSESVEEPLEITK